MGDSPTIYGFVVHVQEKKMFSIARRNFAVRLSRAGLRQGILVILLSIIFTGRAFPQESASSRAGIVTPLSELLAEAEKQCSSAAGQIHFARASRRRCERLHELLKFGRGNPLPHGRRVSRLGGISTIHSGGPASGDTVGPGAGSTSCDVSATATAASGAGRSGWKAMMLKGGKTNSAE